MAGRGAVSGELQSLVDALAAGLGRSVVVDDPGIRLVCASRHFGDEDPVRVRTGCSARRVARSSLSSWGRRRSVAGRRHA